MNTCTVFKSAAGVNHREPLPDSCGFGRRVIPSSAFTLCGASSTEARARRRRGSANARGALGVSSPRRRDFCRPRAGDPRKSKRSSRQLLAMNSSSAGDHTLLTASGATIATAVAPESSLESRSQRTVDSLVGVGRGRRHQRCMIGRTVSSPTNTIMPPGCSPAWRPPRSGTRPPRRDRKPHTANHSAASDRRDSSASPAAPQPDRWPRAWPG